MSFILAFSKILAGCGIILAILAAVFPGPGTLTLFLSFGQLGIIAGISLYLTVVIRDLKEKDVL